MQKEVKEWLNRLSLEIEEHIEELQGKLKHYNPFNVLANVIFSNQYQIAGKPSKDSDTKSPAIQEYLALICLKSPVSLRIGELTRANSLLEDLHDINRLADLIVKKHSALHYHQYKVFKEDGTVSDLDHIAQSISAEELLVRNPTFESFHWDQLEELYAPYNEYFKQTIGFNVNEAIRVCLTIADYMAEGASDCLKRCHENAKNMAEEVLAYKYHKKIPNNFYPEERLRALSSWSDKDIKQHFLHFFITYEMTFLGDLFSFTTKDIAEMELLDINTVQSFLGQLSIGFGEIDPDFARPEVMHPLKDRPILRQKDRYLCSSVYLLDYSLDRLFEQLLNKDNRKAAKYMLHRHDYLLTKGMKMIGNVLQTKEVYTNLYYPGGELDGLIFCDTNVFYIEAKGHKVTDRARKGFLDRVSNLIDDIVKHSYEQGLRTHKYFFGKREVTFTDKKGKKIVLNGARFKNAFFISLALENVSSISCNLKLNNSLGLFDKDTFPWIVSLYDLRAICDHMEGPAYFIQYLHRRKKFFKFQKFKVDDELAILGYYLQRNLRFDDVIKKHYDDVSYIKLDSYLDKFNDYYYYVEGKTSKPVPKMKHYTIQAIKDLVSAIQDSALLHCTDAAVQVLEFGSETKKQLIKSLKELKKRFRKDGQSHDMRIGGDDEGDTWMLSYMINKHTQEALLRFKEYAKLKNQESPSDSYIAIFDTSATNYEIKEIIHYYRPSSEAKDLSS